MRVKYKPDPAESPEWAEWPVIDPDLAVALEVARARNRDRELYAGRDAEPWSLCTWNRAYGFYEGMLRVLDMLGGNPQVERIVKALAALEAVERAADEACPVVWDEPEGRE